MAITEPKISPPFPPVSLRELTELLVRHYGLSEGKFDLLVNYQVGSGLFGPSPNNVGPGLAVSLQDVSLVPARAPNHLTVDASEIAARKKRRQAK